jgi:4-hydroxybenzoate polyprenyltransferase
MKKQTVEEYKEEQVQTRAVWIIFFIVFAGGFVMGYSIREQLFFQVGLCILAFFCVYIFIKYFYRLI